MDEYGLMRRLKEDVINFDVDDIREAAALALKAGITPERAVKEALEKGMDAVDERYRKDEYFLPDLVMAGEAFAEATKVLFGGSRLNSGSEVVLATVKGDIHDIGKNILSCLLNGAGVSVHDLGVDVRRSEIIESVDGLKPYVLGLSSMVTTTRGEIKSIIDELERRGLRRKVKVIIGGESTNVLIAKMAGADAHARDASEGVRIIKKWIRGK